MPKIYQKLLVIFLIVVFNLPTCASTNKAGQSIRDSIITTIVKAKITKNKHLNPLNISVSTNNGEVKLRGRVNDKESFVDTIRTATSTKGVKDIDASELEIKTINSSFTDAYITTKIEAAILEAKVIDDESIPLVGINATTDNGIVTVSGTVSSTKSITAILKRIHHLKGVKKVISNLAVKKTPPMIKKNTKNKSVF